MVRAVRETEASDFNVRADPEGSAETYRPRVRRFPPRPKHGSRFLVRRPGAGQPDVAGGVEPRARRPSLRRAALWVGRRPFPPFLRRQLRAVCPAAGRSDAGPQAAGPACVAVLSPSPHLLPHASFTPHGQALFFCARNMASEPERARK